MNEPSDWPTPNYEDPDLAGSLEGSLATSIILGSIAVAAVIARLWSRFRILHRVGLDDMLIVIALVGFAEFKGKLSDLISFRGSESHLMSTMRLVSFQS